MYLGIAFILNIQHFAISFQITIEAFLTYMYTFEYLYLVHSSFGEMFLWNQRLHLGYMFWPFKDDCPIKDSIITKLNVKRIINKSYVLMFKLYH